VPKTKLFYVVYIFGKYWPIFTIFLLIDPVKYLLLGGMQITSIRSLHYLVKHKYLKTNNIYRWADSAESLVINV